MEPILELCKMFVDEDGDDDDDNDDDNDIDDDGDDDDINVVCGLCFIADAECKPL